MFPFRKLCLRCLVCQRSDSLAAGEIHKRPRLEVQMYDDVVDVNNNVCRLPCFRTLLVGLSALALWMDGRTRKWLLLYMSRL